jgi:PAS domain S-box-containing protein
VEEALRESEERYRTVAVTASDAIITIDEKSKILFINPAAERIFGFTIQEMLGQELTMLMPEYLRHVHRAGIRRYLGTGERHIPWQGVELVGLHKSGKEVPIEVSFGEFAKGDRRLFTGFVRDITERKQAERDRARILEREQAARQQAEEASRLKDEFLATVSHELRTPLTAGLGWACLLRTGEIDQAACERAFEAIERNARAQSQIIEDLLDVSRIITGKLRLKVLPVDLAQVIATSLDAMRPAAEAKKIQIKTTLEPLVHSVSGDPDRLQQIVWNLVSNAVKFTPRAGNIEVRLEEIDDEAVITVRDTGPGINREFLPFVFDRFRQADGSFTRSHSGLGLGLAIARHLVELHGGTIEAINAEDGRGAILSVRLPALKTGAERTPREEQTRTDYCAPALVSGLRLEHLRILVVEDEPDTQELLALVFRQTGAEVETAESVSSAMSILRHSRVDVLLSDIQMPGQNGYDLIEQARTLAAERGTPLTAVAVTAHARVEDRARALRAGFQAHVAKPIDPAELVMMVASLVHQIDNQ